MRIIEAALFSAGHPLGLEELKDTTELPEKDIKAALKGLIQEYKERDTALEVAKVGEKYAMQIKSEYATSVQKIAAMEIPYKVLKTAALIAYHQPLRQSELLKMVGYKVYDHVKILHELGLIRRRDSGRTKIITTTERFSEYFGINSTDREDIKNWLKEKLNIPVEEIKAKAEVSAEVEEEAGNDTNVQDIEKSENTIDEEKESSEMQTPAGVEEK